MPSTHQPFGDNSYPNHNNSKILVRILEESKPFLAFGICHFSWLFNMSFAHLPLFGCVTLHKSHKHDVPWSPCLPSGQSKNTYKALGERALTSVTGLE
jgi:hypothetical protein